METGMEDVIWNTLHPLGFSLVFAHLGLTCQGHRVTKTTYLVFALILPRVSSGVGSGVNCDVGFL